MVLEKPEIKDGDIECKVPSGAVWVFPRLTLAVLRGNPTLRAARRKLDRMESVDLERQLRVVRLDSSIRETQAQLAAAEEHQLDLVEILRDRLSRVREEYDKLAAFDLELNDEYGDAMAEFVFAALTVKYPEFREEDLSPPEVPGEDRAQSGQELFEELFDAEDLFEVYKQGYLVKKKRVSLPEAMILRAVLSSDVGGEIFGKDSNSPKDGVPEAGTPSMDSVRESFVSDT